MPFLMDTIFTNPDQFRQTSFIGRLRMTLSYGVAQIFAPAMAGYIATSTGSYQGALIVTALVMVGGMALLQALLNEEKRNAHH